jgi:large subunit ribosomal protein L9
VDVILLNDVEKVGDRGEVVTVADGYARNYLLPRRLAERATPAKVAEVRRRDELRARQEARTAEQAREIAEVLAKTVLRFEVRAGPGGALFGSVTAADVADEIWRVRKVRVDRRQVALEDPIKRVGRYELPIAVFEGVDVVVKTLVVPEGGELPPEEVEAAAPEEVEAAAPEEVEAAPQDTAVEPEDTGVEPEDTAVEPAEAAAQVPEDAFDRAADRALESE